MSEMPELKNRLQEVREEKKSSRVDLAKSIGRSPSMIQLLEVYNHDPKLSDALLIANSLGVSIHDIWHIENEHDRKPGKGANIKGN